MHGRLVAASAVTAALLVPLAVFGTPAIAGSIATAVGHEYGHHPSPSCTPSGPSGGQYGPSGGQDGSSGGQYSSSGGEYGSSGSEYGSSGGQYGSSGGEYGSSGSEYGSSGGQYGSSGGQYGSGCGHKRFKVTLCHRTHSKKHPWVLIKVWNSAVNGHLKHNDVAPPCSVAWQPQGHHKGHGRHHGHHGHDKSDGKPGGNG